MNSFTYARATDVADAVRQGGEFNAKYLGGGTNLVDLMRETLERPSALVDRSSALSGTLPGGSQALSTLAKPAVPTDFNHAKTRIARKSTAILRISTSL